MGKHIEAIDILKGLTIFLVVLGHAVQGMSSSLKLNSLDFSNRIILVKTFIYSFHMPLFFMIAGLFVEFWLKKDFYIAFYDKAKRLILPYCLWSFIIATIMQIASKYTNDGLGYKDLAKALYIPFSQYWFLYALFFMHLLLYLIYKMNIKHYPKLFLALSGFAYLTVNFIPNIWILPTLARFTLFFAIGMYVKQYIDIQNYKVKITNIVLSLALFVLSNVLRMYFLLHLPDWEYLAFFMTSLSGSYLSWNIACIIGKHTNGLSRNLSIWGGLSSMEIYCMHLIPLAGARIFLLKLLHITNYWAVIIAITIISIVSCYVVLRMLPYKNSKLKLIFGL